MTRVVVTIAGIAFLIAMTFGELAVLALPATLLFGLAFGIPTAIVLAQEGWTAWWHSLLGGIACSLPVLGLYLLFAPLSHTDYVGPYNSMYAVLMGAIGGLVFWQFAVFGNPYFKPTPTRWTPDLALAPLIVVAIFLYRGELAPQKLHACITAYEELNNPTAYRFSRVTIRTDDGGVGTATLSKGSADPGVVGYCAWLSRKRTMFLRGYSYTVHSTRSRSSRCCEGRYWPTGELPSC